MKTFLTLENLNNGLELSPEFNPLNISEDRIYQLEMVVFEKGWYISEEMCNQVPQTQKWGVFPEGIIIHNEIRNSECCMDTQKMVLKEDLPNWLARKLYK